MKFCTENAGDIRKYFQGTYIKFPEAGDTLHWVDRVHEDHIKGKLYALEGDTVIEEPFIYYLNPLCDSSPEVEFIMPRKSYFTYKKQVFLLTRIPARQYHKGINVGNTSICRLTEDGKFSGQQLKSDLVDAYIRKPAWSLFADIGAYCYAVSRRMAVDGEGRLFLDKTRIGQVDYKNKVVRTFSELFAPEIQRLLSVTGQQWSVATVVPKEGKKGPKIKTIEESEVAF